MEARVRKEEIMGGSKHGVVGVAEGDRNGANEVMNVRVVTIGLVNQSHVHPREIFADVLTDRASSLIIAHNHPSGNLQPGKEDIDITQKIVEVARILGLRLIDHIIFSKNGYFSFLESGRLHEYGH